MSDERESENGPRISAACVSAGERPILRPKRHDSRRYRDLPRRYDAKSRAMAAKCEGWAHSLTPQKSLAEESMERASYPLRSANHRILCEPNKTESIVIHSNKDVRVMQYGGFLPEASWPFVLHGPLCPVIVPSPTKPTSHGWATPMSLHASRVRIPSLHRARLPCPPKIGPPEMGVSG
jgi:hypothetical protein